jgi:hypothetical protein
VQEQWVKAQTAFEEKFWMSDHGIYSYGVTEKGERVHEKTPWSGVAMMFELEGADRPRQCIETLNTSDLCTDWGVRSLARSSSLFEPTNYNYGAVWPFIGSFFTTAQFRHGFSLPAFQLLEANIGHATDNALGSASEVFSGEINAKLSEAYHHQGFSTSGYMLPFVRGMLGLEVNAITNSVRLSPKFPADWDSVQVRNIRAGRKTYDLVITRTDTSQSVAITQGHDVPVEVVFTPSLPPGAEHAGVRFNEKHFSFKGTSIHTMKRGDKLSVLFTPVPEILPPLRTTRVGDPNRGLRVISQRPDGRNIHVKVEGIVGETYTLLLHRPDLVTSVSGASLSGNRLIIPFDAGGAHEFVQKTVTLTRR